MTMEQPLRYRIEPDDIYDMESLKGDMFNHDCCPEIPEDELKRQETAFENEVNEHGVWGYIVESKCECCGQWKDEDSCWGFIGYEDAEDAAKQATTNSTINTTEG